LADEDPKKGVWLDPAKTLEHYLLRENVRSNLDTFDVNDSNRIEFGSGERLLKDSYVLELSKVSGINL